MKIAISGANGFIGKSLVSKLKASGYEVIPIQRSLLYADATKLTSYISGKEAIIHLAGSPILKRWTNKSKKAIFDSRVQTTKNLVEAISLLGGNNRPKIFLSASAIGIYKAGLAHTEESLVFSEGFMYNVVSSWEEASALLPKNVGRVILRLGIVIGKESQTIKMMKPIFNMGLGATIGNGKQAFPFIHIKDLTNAIVWSLENSEATGIYNLASPENITNKDFTLEFARVLKRRAFLKIPKVLLKIAFGKASMILTESPQVVPKKLLDQGFEFTYPSIQKSMAEITQKKTSSP